MSIIRAPRPKSNYTIVDKRLSENAGLSWSARGLAIFIQGKPDNWRVSVAHLRKQTVEARIKTGRDGIYALLNELKAAGYITTRQRRKADGTRAEVEYVFHEEPLPAQPEAVGPCPAEPVTAETTLTSTERAASPTPSTKTDSSNKAPAEVALARTVEEFNPDWPDDWCLDQGIVEDFRKHCRDVGKPLTASAWKQTCRDLQELWDKGVDLSESLSRTMQGGWVIPVDPTRGKQAKIARLKGFQQRQIDQDTRWVERNLPPGASDSHCVSAAALDALL